MDEKSGQGKGKITGLPTERETGQWTQVLSGVMTTLFYLIQEKNNRLGPDNEYFKL